MTISRRDFLQAGSAVAPGFLGLRLLVESEATAAAADNPAGYGQPVSDPQGILDLPKGFSYRIISKVGEPMADGFLVPGLPDGMAAFSDEATGLTVIVRNHELIPTQAGSPFGKLNRLFDKVPAEFVYDAGAGLTPGIGGTTNIVFNTKTQKVERQFLSLTGTHRNCAGGPTPWGTWLTCEESVATIGFNLKGAFKAERDHGFVFEGPASAEPGLTKPVPIKGMGRFNHEAVAIEPRTGIVYLTEDREDGCLYRFIPAKFAENRPDFSAGGRLQALVVTGRPSLDTRNWDADAPTVMPRAQAAVEWLDLNDVEAPNDDLRERAFNAGAARFARGEGIWYGASDGKGGGDVYFACTSGGTKRLGQIWKYTPSPAEGSTEESNQHGRLELFVESNSSKLLENADNLTVAPWRDLFVCEDRGTKTARIIGVTPEGSSYVFANGRLGSELAGATFSPDSSTLFFNMQKVGLTFAVTGPWRQG
jgi:secreted PhoX family phosphatase